jgi:hypothetical protein
MNKDICGYLTIIFPGEHGQYVQETWPKHCIISVFYDDWKERMIARGITPENINEYQFLEHWKTTHWAIETDEFGKLIKDTHD